MRFDPKIWGPHYWFVLYSIGVHYPERPHAILKKQYYTFIQSLPLFLPDSESGATFSELLEQYPVTPYLDTRMSFLKWIHFMHNQINESLGKPKLSFYDAMKNYYEHYKPKEVKEEAQRYMRQKWIWGGVVLGLLSVGVYMKYTQHTQR